MRNRSLRKNSRRRAGSSVMARTAATIMAKFLVYANGLKSRPSCASSVSTGRNETAITSSAKKLGPPTSFTAFTTTVWESSLRPVRCHSSSFLCVCSTTTMAASTMAPMAIAIAAERHDVGGHTHHADRNERNHHRDRNVDNRNRGAGHVPEEDQNNQRKI